MSEPIIITAYFEPNPAGAGSTTLRRVIAAEGEPDPSTQAYQSSEFRAGEV